MDNDDEPPDCKYKPICNFYETNCYESSCWRVKFLDGMIKENVLEKILEGFNNENGKNRIALTESYML